jgi:hypothetical protein
MLAATLKTTHCAKMEKRCIGLDVKEPRRSPLRLSRGDDEDVFGWDVKKHLLAMMPHENR